MPEEKRAEETAASPDPTLDQAIKEAQAAVEARENASESDSDEIEVELEGESSEDAETAAVPPAEGGPSKTADSAINEALITAKRELEVTLGQTQKEAQHLREKWLRSAADLENYKRRASKERDEIAKFGNEKLLKDFLPIIDDIDRAVSMIDEGKEQENENQLLDGVKLVRKKFLTQLEKHSVTSFDSEGEVFDPARHEAVQQVHSDKPQGAVVTEFQRGFMISGRLLRPAMVTVSLGPDPKPSEEKE